MKGVILIFLSSSAPALLFLARRNDSYCSLWQGFSLCRGCRAPKLIRRYAVTRPQFGTLDRSNKFASHRFFWLHLNQRPVTHLRRRSLRVCARRKTDCGKNNYRPHRHFLFAFSPDRRTDCCSQFICARNLPISCSIPRRPGLGGSLRAVACNFDAISPSTCKSVAFISSPVAQAC